MGQTVKATRENRTITVDFQDQTTYFRLLDDTTAFVEFVLAFFLSLGFRCSSTTTLIMNRLEFGGQKLSKCPDMIGEPRHHRRGSGEPFRLNQAQDMLILVGERQSPTHVRSCHLVEGLEEDHPLPQAFAVFAEAGRLTRQRCQGLTQGQSHPFALGSADGEAQWG